MKQYELDAYKNHLARFETPKKFEGAHLTEKKNLESLNHLQFGYQHRDGMNKNIGYK